MIVLLWKTDINIYHVDNAIMTSIYSVFKLKYPPVSRFYYRTIQNPYYKGFLL